MSRVLIVGDHFIPASAYVDALDGGHAVATVQWGGTKAEQHAAQHRMELAGPDAVAFPEELRDPIARAEVLALHFAPVSRALMEAAPDLRAVVVARAGVENVDVDAATERGIAVVNVGGRNASAVAELAIGLMLAEARDVARADASIKSGGWRKEFPGAKVELAGATVGLVGFGHVGRALAAKLAGFAPRLLVFDPHVAPEVLAEVGAEAVGIEALFARSDFVSVQARVTPETERFVDAALLARMKPSAYFVNVGRSRLVDTEALLATLQAGAIAGAALDVFDEEPLPEDSPWRALDNVTLTTHYGGDTEGTNATSARLVADAVAELARTGRAARTVNPGAQAPPG